MSHPHSSPARFLLIKFMRTFINSQCDRRHTATTMDRFWMAICSRQRKSTTWYFHLVYICFMALCCVVWWRGEMRAASLREVHVKICKNEMKHEDNNGNENQFSWSRCARALLLTKLEMRRKRKSVSKRAKEWQAMRWTIGRSWRTQNVYRWIWNAPRRFYAVGCWSIRNAIFLGKLFSHNFRGTTVHWVRPRSNHNFIVYSMCCLFSEFIMLCRFHAAWHREQ